MSKWAIEAGRQLLLRRRNPQTAEQQIAPLKPHEQFIRRYAPSTEPVTFEHTESRELGEISLIQLASPESGLREIKVITTLGFHPTTMVSYTTEQGWRPEDFLDRDTLQEARATHKSFSPTEVTLFVALKQAAPIKDTSK